MSKYTKTIGGSLFPDIQSLAIASYKRNPSNKPKTIDWVKEFKHTGYVRKIHSISTKVIENNTTTFHIAESTFHTNDDRRFIKCFDKDYFLLSDYYTDKQLTFYNKLILVQCDFSLDNNYKIICTKEAPHNKVPISELESSIAKVLFALEDIKII